MNQYNKFDFHGWTTLHSIDTHHCELDGVFRDPREMKKVRSDNWEPMADKRESNEYETQNFFKFETVLSRCERACSEQATVS